MTPRKQGLLQALGVFFYCSLVGIIFWKGNDIFGEMSPYFGPLAILLLFSTSVLICAVIVLYKPYKLFIAGERKEALGAIISTAVWLFVLFLVFLGAMIIF